LSNVANFGRQGDVPGRILRKEGEIESAEKQDRFWGVARADYAEIIVGYWCSSHFS
jgi:hypothetical protein